MSSFGAYKELSAEVAFDTVDLHDKRGRVGPVGGDVVLSVLAGALCAALRKRLPGYATARPDTLQRRFIGTNGKIINGGNHITVRLNRRTYSPVLRQSNIPATTVPWWATAKSASSTTDRWW